MNLSRFSTPAGVKNCGDISVNFRNGRARRRVEGAGFRLGEYNDVSEINSFITSGVVVKCSHVMSNVKCCVTTGN